MHDLLTLFLPLYFLLFFGLAFLWRSWRTYRETGINPYRLLGNPGPERVTSRYFRLLPIASLLVVALYLAGAEYYALLAPLQWLQHPSLQWLGLALMSLALVVVLLAQAQMGDAWRIGVDYENDTRFVQRGLFRYSRNPIFVGILLSVLGYFLLLPNALNLLILMLDLALIQVQVSIEEQHLAGRHGEAYARYRREVRRWV